MPAREIHFEASAPIQARPAVVWDILTDYRNGHLNILPPYAFSNMRIEAGGKGAGTIISYVFRAAGVKRTMRHIVSAPSPGQALVESDAEGSVRTTFALTPLNEGHQTLVNISTVQRGRGGPLGAIEQVMTPLIAPTMRRIYLDELRRLDALAQGWPGNDANE